MASFSKCRYCGATLYGALIHDCSVAGNVWHADCAVYDDELPGCRPYAGVRRIRWPRGISATLAAELVVYVNSGKR